MASKAGPDDEDRKNPGDNSTNPTGASAPEPAEGSDDNPPPDEGSPKG